VGSLLGRLSHENTLTPALVGCRLREGDIRCGLIGVRAAISRGGTDLGDSIRGGVIDKALAGTCNCGLGAGARRMFVGVREQYFNQIEK
jgi:hypothetical protein